MSQTKKSTTMTDHATRVLAEQQRQQAGLDRVIEEKAELETLRASHEAADQPIELATALAAETERTLSDEYQTDEHGMRVDQALTMPLMLPVPRPMAVDWIMRNVVASGVGTHVMIGRLVGTAIGFEERETEWQGKQLKSIMLTGLFRMQSALTELTRENAELYLPIAYAKQVKAALQMGEQQVTFDVDIGIEATGRTIPYAWTVVSHLRRKPNAQLEAIWNRRTVQPSLLAAPDSKSAA